MQGLREFVIESLDGDKELVAFNYDLYFDNQFDCFKQGEDFFKDNETPVLTTRKKFELHFHKYLEHQLFTRLQEIKYYSPVDITDTRRLVAVSADCISMIQLLVRDYIHVIVHFRSSDFDGALPADLEFICTLPHQLIVHLSKMKEAPSYEECDKTLFKDLKNMPVKISLSFGSLHRTNND